MDYVLRALGFSEPKTTSSSSTAEPERKRDSNSLPVTPPTCLSDHSRSSPSTPTLQNPSPPLPSPSAALVAAHLSTSSHRPAQTNPRLPHGPSTAITTIHEPIKRKDRNMISSSKAREALIVSTRQSIGQTVVLHFREQRNLEKKGCSS